jgi:hypothetical protein
LLPGDDQLEPAGMSPLPLEDRRSSPADLPYEDPAPDRSWSVEAAGDADRSDADRSDGDRRDESRSDPDRPADTKDAHIRSLLPPVDTNLPDGRGAYQAKHAAELLGCDYVTVLRRLERGDLDGHITCSETGRRRFLVSADAITAQLLKELETNRSRRGRQPRSHETTSADTDVDGGRQTHSTPLAILGELRLANADLRTELAESRHAYEEQTRLRREIEMENTRLRRALATQTRAVVELVELLSHHPDRDQP